VDAETVCVEVVVVEKEQDLLAVTVVAEEVAFLQTSGKVFA
jgi:hypothetical protein